MKRVSIRRILVALGLFFVVGAVASVGVLIAGNWVTPWEKSSMRVALDRIDDVQEFRGNNKADYDARIQAANNAMSVCKKRAITENDHRLVTVLGLQLEDVVAEQEARSQRDVDPRILKKMLGHLEDGNRRTEAMIRSHVQ